MERHSVVRRSAIAVAIASIASVGCVAGGASPVVHAATAPAKAVCTGNAQGQPPKAGEQDHCTVTVVDPAYFTKDSGWGFHIDGPAGVTVAPGGCVGGPHSDGASGGPDGCGFIMNADAAKDETLADLTFDVNPPPAVAAQRHGSPRVSGGPGSRLQLSLTVSSGATSPMSVTGAGAGIGATPGYWLVAADGGVFPFGPGAGGYGSTGDKKLNKPIVGMASTNDGGGYWLVASDGGVFSFGDALFYGSTGSTTLNKPVVGMATVPGGQGYWLVASDGGVFPFGPDAVGYGSTGDKKLNKPIVGMAASPTGRGYWLVASDGGIFPFGDAVGYGSTGDRKLNAPVVGMAATPGGDGYWLAAADGGVFTFGKAAFLGSMGGQHLNQPVVGMARDLAGVGYWLVASDGGIFPNGKAPGYGSTGNMKLNQPIVGMTS
jgi:hypothetical protein